MDSQIGTLLPLYFFLRIICFINTVGTINSVSTGTKGWNLCQESKSDGPNATACTSVGYYVLHIFSECWFCFCNSCGVPAITKDDVNSNTGREKKEKKGRKKYILFSPRTKLITHCRLISFAAYDLQIIWFNDFYNFWIKHSWSFLDCFYELAKLVMFRKENSWTANLTADRQR